MLNRAKDSGQLVPTQILRHPLSVKKKNTRKENKLCYNPEAKIAPLGCIGCPEQNICGGLKIESDFFDCSQFCCGKPNECDIVCRKNPDYVDRVREIGSFDLATVPRAPALQASCLPAFIPLIYHKSGRNKPLQQGTVALPLYALIDRKHGTPKFHARQALLDFFCLAEDTAIVLSGTDTDPPLERWWELEESVRNPIIANFRALEISLVTTPNYSLFTNRPRHDDLHSMKRIGLIHAEFLKYGMPAALHVNGRTERDFARWSEYVQVRPEITHIAYEFTTGSGRASRQKIHVEWLLELASYVDRPLHLIVRGGSDQWDALSSGFGRLTIIDTNVFMKTMKRKVAVRRGNSKIAYMGHPTKQGEPLDDLLEKNIFEANTLVTSLFDGGRPKF